MCWLTTGILFTISDYTIDYRDYVYGIGNGSISRDTPLNSCTQYVDMGMGQRAQKMSQNLPKIMKNCENG